MTAIGKTSLKGIIHDDFWYSFLLKSSDAVAADAGYKAMTIDTSAANTARLATDGDKILGRLEIFENRTAEGILLGTISLKGGMKFIVDPNATASAPDETPAVGDYIVGAVSNAGVKGLVRKAADAELAAGKANWLVVEIGTDTDGSNFVIAINV